MGNPEVLIEEMTRKEISEVFSHVEVIIIPVGSTEQHGNHLPLKHDTAQVFFIAREAAKRLYPKILVTPPVCFGLSAHHLPWPLTITLQPETFVNLIVDICRSLKYHGIKRVLILNGHGGNKVERLFREDLYVEPWNKGSPIEEAARRAGRLGLKVSAVTWWDLIPEDRLAGIFNGRIPGHAGEFETSFGLFMYPDEVRKVEMKMCEGISDGIELASVEKGKVLFEEAIKYLISYLNGFMKE